MGKTIGEMPMAIPAARIETVAEEYASNGFNATLAYKAAHPNAEGLSARVGASKFITKFNIREKAAEILRKNKVLQLPQIINGFAEHLDAKEGVYFKGKRIAEEPIHSIRLEARKFVAEKLYGLGQQEINIDNRSVNVSLMPADTDKLSALIDKLAGLQAISTVHCSKREQSLDI